MHAHTFAHTRTHAQDLILEIGKEEPALFKVLLDGLMWHSKHKLPGGQVRVNYYIKDIYGVPTEYIDPWRSPLAHLIRLKFSKIVSNRM
jgi:hypothetical protein